jgi:xylulose-5-phosphate/fructose-6-phosphate phosphoketolase
MATSTWTLTAPGACGRAVFIAGFRPLVLTSYVCGYQEKGTTTTPFDMVMLNDLDRYHLFMDVIDRVPGLGARTARLRQQMEDARLRARAWTREYGGDMPEVAQWTWPESE